MNAAASTPFSGLKAALTGLMSGGWIGLLLHLLYGRRIAAALGALEALFARWQAGALPPLQAAVPAPVSLAPPQATPRKTTARSPAPRQAAPRRARRPARPAARAARSAIPPVRATHAPRPKPNHPRPARRPARSTITLGNSILLTSILLRYRNI